MHKTFMKYELNYQASRISNTLMYTEILEKTDLINDGVRTKNYFGTAYV